METLVPNPVNARRNRLQLATIGDIATYARVEVAGVEVFDEKYFHNQDGSDRSKSVRHEKSAAIEACSIRVIEHDPTTDDIIIDKVIGSKGPNMRRNILWLTRGVLAEVAPTVLSVSVSEAITDESTKASAALAISRYMKSTQQDSFVIWALHASEDTPVIDGDYADLLGLTLDYKHRGCELVCYDSAEVNEILASDIPSLEAA